MVLRHALDLFVNSNLTENIRPFRFSKNVNIRCFVKASFRCVVLCYTYFFPCKCVHMGAK